MTEAIALHYTFISLAFVFVLFSAEYIVAFYNGSMDKYSLMDWEICSLRTGWLFTGWRVKIFNILYTSQIFVLIMIVRAMIALLLAFYFDTSFKLLLVTLLLFMSFITNIRHVHGRDGADELVIIELSGLFVYYIAGISSPLRWSGLLFIVAQVTLSYLVSGVAKLISPTWRSGDAIIKIFATRIYGKPQFIPFLSHRLITLSLAWFTILWETTFPIIWVAPFSFGLLWIIAGVMFHLGTAYVMGLNTFLFTFLSSYPIILWMLLDANFIAR
ncbi:MAG: hypothetical protein N5P05_001186 [Chroococcopsis gigantea SAG 12.99]|jgi:hypothetical protein|nr:hypothetical protein [Chlorogloea purpurea SAG 13.99]MDV2999580.1 hypothetical protein [Chroococcopsis gigantea SAG 12.99]